MARTNSGVSRYDGNSFNQFTTIVGLSHNNVWRIFTVNTASRMESSSAEGRVKISQSTYELIKADVQFSFTRRGRIKAKNKGEIEMHYVDLAS